MNTSEKFINLFWRAIVLFPLCLNAQITWKRVALTEENRSEGAGVGDFNNDGNMDVVAGAFWYPGPDFDARHFYIMNNSEWGEAGWPDFIYFMGYDFNEDGWDDIFYFEKPGQPAFWFENPKRSQEPDNPTNEDMWVKHQVFDVVDGESPILQDITGDGKPEIIAISNNALGWGEPDWNDPALPWTWHSLSPPMRHLYRWAHGMGIGDVNGDGRMDYLESEGWWEQPESIAGDPEWLFHPHKFGDTLGVAPITNDIDMDPDGIRVYGAAHMFAYDVDGDGDNDVITAPDAHGYGLAWFEHLEEQDSTGGPKFQTHWIFQGKEEMQQGLYEVAFSQPHAIELVDVNGDGLKDIVIGKRVYPHSNSSMIGPPEAQFRNDLGWDEPGVLYWFELKRSADGQVEWIPHMVDDNSGVGIQVMAADVNDDDRPDIVVSNKKGSFVFIQEGTPIGTNITDTQWHKINVTVKLPQASARFIQVIKTPWRENHQKILTIYDIHGKEVVKICYLKENVGQEGIIQWNGRNSDGKTVPSGVYWAKF
jgi:hypothetical protein